MCPAHLGCYLGYLKYHPWDFLHFKILKSGSDVKEVHLSLLALDIDFNLHGPPPRISDITLGAVPEVCLLALMKHMNNSAPRYCEAQSTHTHTHTYAPTKGQSCCADTRGTKRKWNRDGAPFVSVVWKTNSPIAYERDPPVLRGLE